MNNTAYFANGQHHSCSIPDTTFLQDACNTSSVSSLRSRSDNAGDQIDGSCEGNLDPVISGSLTPGQAFVAVAPGEGVNDAVRIFNVNSPSQPTMVVWPFGQRYSGGVRVALADVNGDGYEDLIAGMGEGREGRFVVISGYNGVKLMDQTPFASGGVYVAAGNLLGDGRADVLVGAGKGQQPRALVYNLNQQVVRDMMIYETSYTLGVRVAVGDVNGDGRMDVITSTPPGGGPRVRVIDAVTQQSYVDGFVYEPEFRGGVWIGAVQADGSGKASIVTGADVGGGPRVRVLSVQNGQFVATQDFFAYDSNFRGGVRVSALDKDNNGHGQLALAAGVGGGPQIRIVGAQNLQDFGSFWGADQNLRTGFYISGATPISHN